MIDKNKDWLTYLCKKVNRICQQNIKTSYLAQIVKLTLPTCSVQPLAMIKGNKLPMVEDVHFITYPLQYRFKLNFTNADRYTDTIGKDETPTQRSLNIKDNKPVTVLDKKLNYQVGDTVLVNVLDLDDSYYQGKGKFNVGSHRRHSMDFSIIVGKIASKNDFKFKESKK